MELYRTFRNFLDEETPVAVASVIAGPFDLGAKLLIRLDGSTFGIWENRVLESQVVPDAVRALQAEQSESRTYRSGDEVFDVFFDVYPAPPRLVIVGATQTAIPLSAMARILGYRVVITDARAAFAVSDRFPAADEVIKGWPQDVLPGIPFTPSTFVVLLSHDPKFDEPTLQHVIPTPVRYIGAIGSRKTQQERRERLLREGFSEEQLSKLYGPVGLDLGGRSAEETALAIIAEITAVRFGHSGGHMRRKMLEAVST